MVGANARDQTTASGKFPARVAWGNDGFPPPGSEAGAGFAGMTDNSGSEVA
jgi:hypothetical protein